MERLKQGECRSFNDRLESRLSIFAEILHHQALIGDKEEALRSSDERMQTIDDQHQQEVRMITLTGFSTSASVS